MFRSPRSYNEHAILRDGGSIRIRAIRADDKERLLAHFNRLSDRSRYFRFLGIKRELTPEELVRLTELDFDRDVGLVATIFREGEERIVGVGRYFCIHQPGEERRAELSFAVEDAEQHRGIGTVLLERLVKIGRDAGVALFEADALAENRRMIDVFRSCGFLEREMTWEGVCHVVLAAEETEKAREAIERRARLAAAESLRSILEPRSVALIGASRKQPSIPAAILQNLKKAGFKGPIYPVNPKVAELEGLPCFPRVSAIGAPVDLAVIAVPAEHVEDVVADCARAGVRGLVVISAGFAEVANVGHESQDRLRDFVRAAGMRMVGPNCMGVLNTDPAVSLNATFAPYWPAVGNIGMLTQSGALGLALLDYARKLHIGVSTFVSVGNKADISGNDLLAYWADDPKTDVVALYLESFGNGRKFARVAPVVAAKKPIVAVKSGRSDAGKRAAASHSAALASADVAVEALFEQAGVVRTRTLEEMLDVVSLFASQPLPPGPRVGIVTNAGGPGILLADACESGKLDVPRLAEETLAKLRGFLPAEAGLANPIDMIASASPEQFERTVELVGADPNIDSVIVIYIPPLVSKPVEIAGAIARGAGKIPREKPILSVFISSEGTPAELLLGPRGKIPSFSFPENAAHALSAAVRYVRWKARPKGQVFHFDDETEDAIRAEIDRAPRPGWLAPEALAKVLELADIPLARAVVVAPGEVEAAAERIGYPVVLKAVSKGVLHKSDAGLVLTNLASRVEVSEAAHLIVERTAGLGAELEGILVQQFVSGGLETIVGVTVDPVFGPLIVSGLGGVEVELLKDVSFHLTPVSDVDAREMIDKLKARPLFDGYRGAPKRDRAAFVDLIIRLSALVELVPELAELDLNPVLVLEDGDGAIAVDARLRLT